jgi:hypothetical protein
MIVELPRTSERNRLTIGRRGDVVEFSRRQLSLAAPVAVDGVESAVGCENEPQLGQRPAGGVQEMVKPS